MRSGSATRAGFADTPRELLRTPATAGADDVQVETIVLQAVQEIHRRFTVASRTSQRTSEDRRQLATDVGELTVAMIAALVETGRSEQQARQADVRALARPVTGAGEASR